MSETVHSPGLLAALRRHDAAGLGYLLGRRHRRLDPVMRRLTRLGDPPVVVALTAALLLAGGAVRSAGTVAAVAVAVSHLLVQVLKRRIVRARPSLPPGVELLVQAPDRFSFPSGHAAAALSLALAVALIAGSAGIVVLLVGLSVGVTRCYLGVHYPGDVLMGWLLALLGFAVGISV
jgi:undecaprenyl-diphosphatase